MNNSNTIRVQPADTRQGALVLILVCGLLLLATSHARADVFVITPDASMTVGSGTPVVIRWGDDLEAPLVNIELWDGVRGISTVLAQNIKAPQREINWTVPEDIENGSRYRFVVRDARDTTRAMFSVGFTSLVRRSRTATGIDDLTQQLVRFDVAPLPAADRVRISWTEPLRRIEIIDLTGVVVVRLDPAPGAQSCLVNIAALSAASYTVAAYTGSGSVIRRPLLVQR